MAPPLQTSGMLAAVRVVLCLVLGACGFSVPSTSPIDATDAPEDITISVTWDVDGTSHKGVPSTLQQWRDVIAADQLTMDPPDNLWLMQESGGSLADTIGGATLGPLNQVIYQQSVAGWMRSGAGTRDLDGDHGFASAAIGNLNATSYTVLLYVAVMTPPAVDRSLLGIGASFDHRYAAVGAGAFSARGFNGGMGVGSVPPGTEVHPLLMQLRSSTTTPEYVIYTDKEKISAPWTPPTGLGSLFIVGSAGSGSANARYLYAAAWKGPTAPISPAKAKALLQRLGWTVSF